MNDSNKQYAPVLIPTLNRFEHLRRLIESLARCPEASATELIIGLDYPPSEKYIEGWLQIKEYLPSITGFKKVTVLEADHNLGCRDNMKKLKEYFLTTPYESVIVSEDDNEFSPNFLSFLNWGLEKYKNDERVIAVSGYNYPVNLSNYDKDYYFSHEFSAWGYGMTRKHFSFIRDTIMQPSYLDKLVHNPIKLFKLTWKCGWRMTRMALYYHRRKTVHGDGFITFYNYTENKYCLFPSVSKVRNWGHDGSGIHCVDLKNDDLFLSQVLDSSSIFQEQYDIPVKTDKKVNKALRSYFKYNSLLIKAHIKKIFG